MSEAYQCDVTQEVVVGKSERIVKVDISENLQFNVRLKKFTKNNMVSDGDMSPKVMVFIEQALRKVRDLVVAEEAEEAKEKPGQ